MREGVPYPVKAFLVFFVPIVLLTVVRDVLDVDPANPQATIIADLQHAPHLADELFDTIIFTQTLQLIFHADAALASIVAALQLRQDNPAYWTQFVEREKAIARIEALTGAVETAEKTDAN